VIVSNDAANAVQNRVRVVPLTSDVAHRYPWEALAHVKGRPSKAVAAQIRTVAKERLTGYIGTRTQPDL
jgi:mRNA interferase MazF